MAAVTGERYTQNRSYCGQVKRKGWRTICCCLLACFLVLPALFYVEDCDFPGENESERYVKGGGALTSSIATQTKKNEQKNF